MRPRHKAYTGVAGTVDDVERAGLDRSSRTRNFGLENYMAALENAGFAISALREPIPAVTGAFTHMERWTRIPLFLWLKARSLSL